MKFVTDRRVLIGRHCYPAGSVVEDPPCVFPFFRPLDTGAQKALDLNGVCVDIVREEAPAREDAPEPASKPRRKGTKRQPY